MSELSIRRMELSEVKKFYEHIKDDFVPGEYAPYEIIFKQIQNGLQEGLIFCENSTNLAYSICAADNENGFDLLSLMAVLPEFRGAGIGTLFMSALHEQYAQKKGIIVEVEMPEYAQTSEELIVRNRRIEFYKKLCYYLIPGIDYSIWGVPMHLMALPINTSAEVINDEIGRCIYQIYYSLMGKSLMHKLIFSKKEK